jgi:oxygen-independent coproporphyrinogen-3 oxidase
MLNALRLNDGFSLAQFSARTGQDASSVEDRLRHFQQRGLLEIERGQIKASELGRRFLDTVVAGFF